MRNQPIYKAQLNQVVDFLDLKQYNGTTFFVSGGTGMIGTCVLDLLTFWNKEYEGTISIVASTRDVTKLENRYASEVQWISWDSVQPLQLPPSVPVVDYIIHTASNADPINFSQYPVDTLCGAVVGTGAVLDYAQSHHTKRVLYLSSGEMYGNPALDAQGQMLPFTEDHCGVLDLSNPRSCYPEGKRAAEVLCQSYFRQYGTDVVIARLCHIFGPTMKYRDSRASSEFLRNAVRGKDIVLKSVGLLERSHCYVVDCVCALLFLLDKGSMGEAYNVADARYQMTIRDFAQKVAECSGVSLVFEDPTEAESKGYSQVTQAVLSVDKITELGWNYLDIEGKGNACKETVKILRDFWRN